MKPPIEFAFVFVFADRDVQKLFLKSRQNLQFLFRVASLFVVLCMYVSSHVVCADLVCILCECPQSTCAPEESFFLFTTILQGFVA